MKLKPLKRETLKTEFGARIKPFIFYVKHYGFKDNHKTKELYKKYKLTFIKTPKQERASLLLHFIADEQELNHKLENLKQA